MAPELAKAQDNHMSTRTSPLHELAVQVDTELGRIHEESAAHRARLVHLTTDVHTMARTKFFYRSRNVKVYDDTLAEAEEKLTALIPTMMAWERQSAEATLERLDRTRAALAELARESAGYGEIWAENHGWSRFFMVHGGHIHATMGCSTCRATTLFGWLPQLSGLSEADAVAAHGATLCTKCFPTAPVEWTTDKTPKAR